MEGLEDDRWALISKTHHAMLDGVGGVDLLTALLDLSPDAPPHPPQPWEPRPVPSGVGLLAAAGRNGVGHALRLGGRAASLALRPTEAVRGRCRRRPPSRPRPSRS